MNLHDVKTKTGNLVHSKAFIQRHINYQLEDTPYNVSVDNQNIPVISEWKQGESQFLIFNNLDSCLGLIGINAATTQLKGAHFSLDFDNMKSMNAKVQGAITHYFNGYEIFTFGGSQHLWESYGVTCINNVKVLPHDENQKYWLLLIGNGNIESKTWNY